MPTWRETIGASGSLMVARAQKTQAFWKLRAWLSKNVFRFDRLSSSLKQDAQTLTYTGRVYRELAGISFKGIAASAIFILLAEILESAAGPNIAKLTPNLISLSADAPDFIALIGQIGAVFLGIYFATFGIILSSSYSQIRGDVVDLILREKVNNIYSSYLINLTILSLICAALSYLGYKTGYTIFFTVLVGGLIAILCIFELGKRLFLFFDVSQLVEAEVMPEMVRLITEVSRAKRRSVHLDAHRQRLVSQRIATLRYLSFNSPKSLGQETKPNSKVDFAYSSLLRLYAAERAKIPEDSYWFKRTQKHPEWFFETDSTTSMALQTDMHLFPKEEIDTRWFERALLDGLLASFGKCLEQGNYADAYKTLQYAQTANEALASLLLSKEGITFLKSFSDRVRDHEASPTLPLASEVSSSRFQEITLHLGLTQASYMFAYEYLRSAILFAEKLPVIAGDIDWEKPDFGRFPAPLLERLQSTKRRIEFERSIEGRALMPQAYISQLIAKDFAASVGAGILDVLEEVRRTTTQAVSALIAEKRVFLALPILLSSFRTINQFSKFLEYLEARMKQVHALQVYPEYEIPQVDTPKAREEFAAMRSELVSALCSLDVIGFLAEDIGETEELPDYFGHSYFLLAEECFRACLENEPDKFREAFLGFGILAQIAFSRFYDKKGKVSTEYFLSLLGTIAEDLLSLTGYALVFSVIHDTPNFEAYADEVWEKLLANAHDRQSHLRWIIQIASALKGSFFGAPRSLIRTQWSMQLEQLLRNMGFDDGMSYGRASTRHPSPLVRSVAGLGMNETSEAAIYLLLLGKIEGEFELPDNVANFKASYDRQVERG